MGRRFVVLVAALLVILSGMLFSAMPAGASRSHDVDPTTIDPHALALPATALPPGAAVSYSAVSDNNDADTSRTHEIHNALYEQFHRITGYRMDFTYTVGGVSVDAGYLASIFPTVSDAQAAMDNATNASSIIAYVGHPLPDPCTSGDVCKGFYGPNPDDGTKTALIAISRRGPILVEAAAQVPNEAFATVQSTMEQQVYAVSTAEDQVVQALLSGGNKNPTATAAATPTATVTQAPAPPVATSKPKHKLKPCKKGYKRVHGKCKKVKKKKLGRAD